MNCQQNCDKDNIKLGFRPWLADLFHSGLRPSETFFFLVLLGLLTANFSKVNVGLRDMIFWMPEQAAILLGWQDNGFYLLAVIWIAILLPMLLLLPGYLIYRLGQISTRPVDTIPETSSFEAPPETPGYWRTMGRLSLPFIPLILAAHAVLALVKINAKAGYLPFALGDPSGVKTYLAMNVMQTVTAPGVLVPLDSIKWLIALVLIVGLLLSYRVAWRTSAAADKPDRPFTAASFVGVTILFSMYMATVVEWLFVR
jgi:hypothetical protein